MTSGSPPEELAELVPMLVETNERNIAIVTALLQLATAEHTRPDGDLVDFGALVHIAVLNLLDNALTYNMPGGRIDLVVERNHDAPNAEVSLNPGRCGVADSVGEDALGGEVGAFAGDADQDSAQGVLCVLVFRPCRRRRAGRSPGCGTAPATVCGARRRCFLQ
jgi:hypothetical protein